MLFARPPCTAALPQSAPAGSDTGSDWWRCRSRLGDGETIAVEHVARHGQATVVGQLEATIGFPSSANFTSVIFTASPSPRAVYDFPASTSGRPVPTVLPGRVVQMVPAALGDPGRPAAPFHRLTGGGAALWVVQAATNSRTTSTIVIEGNLGNIRPPSLGLSVHHVRSCGFSLCGTINFCNTPKMSSGNGMIVLVRSPAISTNVCR